MKREPPPERAAGTMLAKMRAAGMLPKDPKGRVSTSPAAAAVGPATAAALPPAALQGQEQYPRAASQPARAAALATPDLRPQSQPTRAAAPTSSGSTRRFPSPMKRGMMDGDDGWRTVGIGVLFGEERRYGQLPVVKSVDPLSAASLNGVVRVGDQIETVDGVETRYMDNNAIGRKIMGPENSNVALGIIRTDGRGNEERVTAMIPRTTMHDDRATMQVNDSTFGGVDSGINLADVLANMRASSASNPVEMPPPSLQSSPSALRASSSSNPVKMPSPYLQPSQSEPLPASSVRDSPPPDDATAGGAAREGESPGGAAGGAPSSQAAASGLRWKNIGDSRPMEGRELKNPELANALQTKTEFTPDEWDDFGIGDVRENDFVNSRNTYFTPAPPKKNYWGALRCVHNTCTIACTTPASLTTHPVWNVVVIDHHAYMRWVAF